VLTDFLYSHPTWLIGLLVVGFWTGLFLLGLHLFHNRVNVEMRKKDTETVGLTYAIVAVVYAVLIAFIVVDVFETFAKADTIATAEANKLSNLMLDSTGLPPQLAEAVRADVDQYIDIVHKKEWPSQQQGKLEEAIFEPGWTNLARLTTRLAAFEPATAGQNVNKAEMLHAVNDLIKARRSRILAAGEHLAPVVWQILLLAGTVAVGYTYLFGARSYRIHLAITGLIAATIALVFVLIIALDYPFRGEVSVSDEAFTNVRATAAGAIASAAHK
jgi:riboflavin transporter FmnP